MDFSAHYLHIFCTYFAINICNKKHRGKDKHGVLCSNRKEAKMGNTPTAKGLYHVAFSDLRGGWYYPSRIIILSQ